MLSNRTWHEMATTAQHARSAHRLGRNACGFATAQSPRRSKCRALSGNVVRCAVETLQRRFPGIADIDREALRSAVGIAALDRIHDDGEFAGTLLKEAGQGNRQ